MTAIVGIQTPEGFVLGADGLTKNGFDETICTRTRKIFFASKLPEYNLAYAWCGSTSLPLWGGVFDFFEVSANVVEELSTCAFPDYPNIFFHAFSCGIRDRLSAQLVNGIIPIKIPSLQGNLIACASFVGYVGGVPTAKQVLFYHSNQRLENSTIDDPTDYAPEKPYIFSGPLLVAPDPTPDLVSDMRNGTQTVLGSLQRIVNAPRTPEESEYGGRLHIAQITQSTTTWADGFAPIGD